VEDVPVSKAIKSIRLNAPELVERGKPFVVQLTIEPGETARSAEFGVWVRINTQSFGHLAPTNDGERCEVRGKSGTVRLRFDLPEGLPPHGYAIRALVASSGAVGAASRGIFVSE